MVQAAILIGSLAVLALGVLLAIRQGRQCPRCERVRPRDGS